LFDEKTEDWKSRDTVPLNHHFIDVKVSLFLAQTPAESISIPVQAQNKFISNWLNLSRKI
jgi:hypothetical protein